MKNITDLPSIPCHSKGDTEINYWAWETTYVLYSTLTSISSLQQIHNNKCIGNGPAQDQIIQNGLSPTETANILKGIRCQWIACLKIMECLLNKPHSINAS